MSPPGAPRAAIIVPHHADPVRLRRCLDALAPQLAQAGAAVEAVVVDNASLADPCGLRADYPRFRVVTETTRGAAHARNRGVIETSAERLFFVDCDCVPGPDWLATALEVAPGADLVGGTITLFDETPGPRSGAEAFETVFAFDNRRYVEREGFSVTANLLTTRAVFRAVGGFRPGLSEDRDWCRRAGAAGFVLVHEDRLRVAHPTRADWPALRRKWRRLTDEAWGMRRRGAAQRAAWALIALAMPLSIPVHALRVLRHPGLGPRGECGRALVTLARLRFERCGWMLRQAVGVGRRHR
ncbi:glycosyltransferase family 2 protein [Limimaricola sp.]|uniref:glycosyltransferase family 2 protein n=1 Tax=Limimaricola sp. TaxID=2211665 RepID=UPI004058F297